MARFQFRCSECDTAYAEHDVETVCPACATKQERGAPTRGVLQVEIDDLPRTWPDAPSSSTEFLTEFLPIPDATHVPPLAVGGTPLVVAPALRTALGMPRLSIKDDARNPSGSTKDRASWLVVAKALEYGRPTVATASTGNAATALAAVAAAAGLRAVVFVPASAPEAKLIQILSYGATVLRVAGSYDDCFELCHEACERFGWYNRNTALNPFTVEGKKTASLEIARDMSPECADVVLVPTGDGVIISGVAKGFADLEQCGVIDRRPRLIAVQPEGSAAIVHALRNRADTIIPVPGAHSVADSLVVEAPRNARMCLREIRASGGGGVAVPDERIVAAISELARLSGVFAEPAAAAALAGLHAAIAEGLVERDERVVLLVTGSGLKDVGSAARSVTVPEPVAPEIEAVAQRLDNIASP
ncbi:MAG: threonine synthase [Gemmatimonadota bacterium]|nr:threonine synthase [Gemmatimonadota bacterium]